MQQSTTRRAFLRTTTTTAVLATAASTSFAKAAKPKLNVLLITSEDNGAELGCYGDTQARTPVLDNFAAEGVRFENAYVTYSVCSPSRAAIFTGLYNHQSGQVGLATWKYSMFPGVKTMPTILKKAGYRTGLVGKLHVNPYSAFSWDY